MEIPWNQSVAFNNFPSLIHLETAFKRTCKYLRDNNLAGEVELHDDGGLFILGRNIPLNHQKEIISIVTAEGGQRMIIT